LTTENPPSTLCVSQIKTLGSGRDTPAAHSHPLSSRLRLLNSIVLLQESADRDARNLSRPLPPSRPSGFFASLRREPTKTTSLWGRWGIGARAKELQKRSSIITLVAAANGSPRINRQRVRLIGNLPSSLGTGHAGHPPQPASVLSRPPLDCRVWCVCVCAPVCLNPAGCPGTRELGRRLFVELRCPQPQPQPLQRPRPRLRCPTQIFRRRHHHCRRGPTRGQKALHYPLCGSPTSIANFLARIQTTATSARGSRRPLPTPSPLLPQNRPPSTSPPRLFTEHRTRLSLRLPSCARRRSSPRCELRWTPPTRTRLQRSKTRSMT